MKRFWTEDFSISLILKPTQTEYQLASRCCWISLVVCSCNNLVLICKIVWNQLSRQTNIKFSWHLGFLFTDKVDFLVAKNSFTKECLIAGKYMGSQIQRVLDVFCGWWKWYINLYYFSQRPPRLKPKKSVSKETMLEPEIYLLHIWHVSSKCGLCKAAITLWFLIFGSWVWVPFKLGYHTPFYLVMYTRCNLD